MDSSWFTHGILTLFRNFLRMNIIKGKEMNSRKIPGLTCVFHMSFTSLLPNVSDRPTVMYKKATNRLINKDMPYWNMPFLNIL